MKKILCILLSVSLLFISSCSKTEPEYQNLMENVIGENVSVLEPLSEGDKAYKDFALKVSKKVSIKKVKTH